MEYKRINFNLDKELAQRLAIYCIKKEMTQAELLRELISKELNENKA